MVKGEAVLDADDIREMSGLRKISEKLDFRGCKEYPQTLIIRRPHGERQVHQMRNQ